MVARRDVRDVGPDLLDDARALVTDYGRHRAGVDPLRGVQVGVANAARDHADQDLAGARGVELELLHDERLPELVEDGGSHGRPPAARAVFTVVRSICGSLLARSRVRACRDLPVWTPLAPSAPRSSEGE